MIRYPVIRVTAFLVFAVLTIVGCGDDDDAVSPSPAPGTVVFLLDHTVGGTPLVLENSSSNFPYVNAAGNAYNVSDLTYYVSKFRVHRNDGRTFGLDVVHLRDAADPSPENRRVTFGGVPTGTYTAVSFTFGIDAQLNVNGGLAPFGFIAMPWPQDWGGGYHYMMMNGMFQNGPDVIAYRTHTGRRFLSNDHPMAVPPGPDDVEHHHFFEVHLPVSFQVTDGETWELPVIMDVNGWYADPVYNHYDFFTGAQMEGVMINLDAQRLLMQNGMRNAFGAGVPVRR